MRLVLDAEVQAGNQTAATYSAADLWSLLDRIPRANWPKFMRADNAYGTNEIMTEAEVRELPYLFKLKMTKNIQRLVKKIQYNTEWTRTVHGFEAQETMLQLQGWSKQRRVIILRQQISSDEPYLTEATNSTMPQQLEFEFGGSKVDKTIR